MVMRRARRTSSCHFSTNTDSRSKASLLYQPERQDLTAGYNSLHQRRCGRSFYQWAKSFTKSHHATEGCDLKICLRSAPDLGKYQTYILRLKLEDGVWDDRTAKNEARRTAD